MPDVTKSHESPPSASNGSGSEPTPSGFVNASNASVSAKCPGRNPRPTTPKSAAAPMIHRSFRHRGEGGRPSGNSRSASPRSANISVDSASPSDTANLPPGSAPGRTTQRVLRVLGRPDSKGDGNPDREEDPADRVAGTSPDDKRAHGRERCDGDEVHRGCDCVGRGGRSVQPGRAGLEADAHYCQRQREAGDRDADGPHRPAEPGGRPSAHRGALSQSETCAGCIVSATTVRSSPLKLSSATWSRSRVPKRSSVRVASYLRR